MNFKKLLALTLVVAAGACGGGGGGGHHSKSSSEVFVDNLNYDDPLETYYVAKSKTLEYGVIVVQEGDGSYFGVDIQNPDRFDFYDYDLDYYLDASFQVFYVGGNLYEDVYGNLYEKNTEVSKDLLKVKAVLGKARAKDIGEQLAANYGLSEERGVELGQMLVEYKDLKKTRAINAADEDRFAQQLFGSKVSDMAKAYEKFNAGQTQDMDKLLEVAAEKNGTTPEHVRELFGTVLGK